MSSFADAASLIVAAFDLLAVRAVTGAARAADLESGDVLTPSGIVEKPEPAPSQNIDTFQPNPEIQTRLVPQRQPTYTRPSQSHCNIRRSAPVQIEWIIPACDLPSAPVCAPTNPIEPPWKVLPWMDRPHQRTVIVKEIKLISSVTDMSFRGKMLDLVA